MCADMIAASIQNDGQCDIVLDFFSYILYLPRTYSEIKRGFFQGTGLKIQHGDKGRESVRTQRDRIAVRDEKRKFCIWKVLQSSY